VSGFWKVGVEPEPGEEFPKQRRRAPIVVPLPYPVHDHVIVADGAPLMRPTPEGRILFGDDAQLKTGKRVPVFAIKVEGCRNAYLRPEDLRKILALMEEG
jgi:hypothetical protein